MQTEVYTSKRISITFTIPENNSPQPKIENLVVTPNIYGLTEYDIQKMLYSSKGYLQTMTRGILVTGSKENIDSSHLKNMLIGITNTLDKPLKLEPTIMYLDDDNAFAKLVRRSGLTKVYQPIILENIKAASSEKQYGLGVFEALDALNGFHVKQILCIWDEKDERVPYLFEPGYDREHAYGRPLMYVWSLKRHRWLTEKDLEPVMQKYHENVTHIEQIKARRDLGRELLSK